MPMLKMWFEMLHRAQNTYLHYIVNFFFYLVRNDLPTGSLFEGKKIRETINLVWPKQWLHDLTVEVYAQISIRSHTVLLYYCLPVI